MKTGEGKTKVSTAVRVSAALIILLSSAAAVSAADGDVAISPKGREAIDKALAYLAETQNEEGSWDTSGYGRATACTSLAALAFMSDGHLPGRGGYGDNVARTLDYVLESAQPSGLLERGLPHHAMYSHAFSTLFLAEVWGTVERPGLRDKLKKAVDLIITTQNREGGWRYQPKVADADISVTVCQIVALRAAANAGIAVPRETIDNAVGYLRKCARPDGGFAYQAGSGQSGVARTGAGLVSLLLAGERDAPEVAKAVAYLMQRKDSDVQYFYYGHYYAAQGMHLLGGEEWKTWHNFISRALVSRQQQNGSWSGSGEDTIQSTAMGILVLTIPNGYLPIYQR